MLLKVGELAKRTGLTVRTLHHYDSIGLLAPSARSQNGYRLYNEADVARLHSIQALRQLGMSLAEIGNLLANKGPALPTIIEQQMAALQQQIAQATELRSRLGRLKDRLSKGAAFDLNEWLTTLKLMAVYDQYFTTDELNTLRENRTKVESEWPPLIAEVRDAMKRGLPPDGETAQELARRWIDLMMRLAGGDRGLLARWKTMRQEQPTIQNRDKLDRKTVAYIDKAIACRKVLWSKYLAPEEIERLRPGDVRKWKQLVLDSRRLMARDKPVEDHKMQALLSDWNHLLDETAGGDPVIRGKLLNALQSEPLLGAGLGMDADVREFILRAQSRGKSKSV